MPDHFLISMAPIELTDFHCYDIILAINDHLGRVYDEMSGEGLQHLQI